VNAVEALRREVAALPRDWHGAGTVGPAALEALQRHASTSGPISHSVETGTGKTTLVLSHLSPDHLVFTQDDTDGGDSLVRVRSSPLLAAARVRFVIGPTQRTLLHHEFEASLDLALLDGPHAYPFPDLEYWAVYPHIRPGGLLAVDDLQIRTIANLFAVLKVDAMWELLEVVEDMAFFRRTTAPAVDPFGEGWWTQGYNHRRARGHLPPAARAGYLARRASQRLVGRWAR
jgi:hypothetical protein